MYSNGPAALRRRFRPRLSFLSTDIENNVYGTKKCDCETLEMFYCLKYCQAVARLQLEKCDFSCNAKGARTQSRVRITGKGSHFVFIQGKGEFNCVCSCGCRASRKGNEKFLRWSSPERAASALISFLFERRTLRLEIRSTECIRVFRSIELRLCRYVARSHRTFTRCSLSAVVGRRTERVSVDFSRMSLHSRTRLHAIFKKSVIDEDGMSIR